MQVNFGSNPAPDANNVVLTIMMNDSAGDGWNGNILAIRQNNTIVGTFGTGFISGSSSGPVYITIQGNSEVQIVVQQVGTKINETAFTVRFPNQTLAFSKAYNTTYNASSILGTFCAFGGCPTTISLVVTMTDSGGNGWNGNIIGFRQNDNVVGTFGSDFTSGASSGPLYISIIPNLNTQIAVVQVGTRTNEVGFIVRFLNGTTIFQRNAGLTFINNFPFITFCPNGGCPVSTNLIISMADLYGDGWNGYVMGIRQNGTIMGTFGNNFTSGSTSGPVNITVQGSTAAQIFVVQAGNWSE